MSETVTLTRDNLRDHLSAYDRTEVRVWGGDPADAPVGGDETFWGYTGILNAGEISGDGDLPAYVEIHATGWGDYGGDYVSRANTTALWADWGEYLVKVTGYYSSESLLLPLGTPVPEELVEIIVGLWDYPVYDGQALSELESALEQSDLESWILYDLRREVEGLVIADDLEEYLDPEYLSDERLSDAYWQARQDDTVQWYAETAVGGYVERQGFSALAADIYAAWKDSTGSMWEAYARSLIPTQPEMLPIV